MDEIRGAKLEQARLSTSTSQRSEGEGNEEDRHFDDLLLIKFASLTDLCFNFSMKETTDIVRETYRTGDYIFFEGDIDFHFYIIEQGQVQIFTKNKSGQRVNIAVIEEGESFGEFALLDKQPRSASAQALTECTLVKVSEKGYQHLLSELPVWASSMLVAFSTRLKNMNHLLKEVPQFLEKKS